MNSNDPVKVLLLDDDPTFCKVFSREAVRQELDAEASGASTVRYRGNPVVSSDSKGLSSIRKD